MAGIECPGCGHRNVEDANFCSGCGGVLAPRCPQCGASVTEAARFCSNCGGSLEAKPPDRQPGAERRQLVVLFCDLVGSTPLSQQLDPEDLRDVIRLYHDAGAKAIARYEGYVAKFLGDGIMAFFGFPVAHEDDSKRSILAALAVVDAVQQLNPQLQERFGIELAVRIGLHTGLVVAGEMGSADRPVLDIVGETPNLAARLQEFAPPNGVVVSGATHRLVESDFHFEALGSKQLRGITDPMPIFRVLAPAEEAAAGQGGRRMVGRSEELGVLKSAWKRAKEGHGRSVNLSGEPGIGKSTLVAAMLSLVEKDKESAGIYLRCSPYHQNTPFYPLVEYIRTSQLQLNRNDPPSEQLERLAEFVKDRGFDPAEAVPILAPLLSIPYEDRFPAPLLSAEGRRIRTIDLLLAMAVQRATRFAVLLVLDNVHWADPSTLELYQRVLDRLERIRMLAIATFRPHFKPEWRASEPPIAMRLERLDPMDIQSLVRQAAGGKSMPPEILHHIAIKTDGVPLFIEELTKAVIESGCVTEAGRGYVLAGKLSDLAIPTTLHGSLVARLERVAGRKEIAQVASVVGREFTPEVVAAVAQIDEATVGRELDNLVSAELIYPVETFAGGRAYRFRHALIQDAAYDSLLKSARQQYHTEIAHTIESRFADTAEEQPEVVANHYSAAGKVEAALAWWSKAGQKALSRSANVEAIAHFTRGLETLEGLPDSPEKVQHELGMLVQRGTALIATKGFAAPEVGETFRRAEVICELIGETPLLFPVIWGLWVYHLVRSDLLVSESYANQMLRLAEISGDSGMHLEGHFTLANTLFWLGRLAEAKDHLDQALALYDPKAHASHQLLYGQDPGVSTLCYSSYAAWSLGKPDQAYAFADRAYELANELQHPFSIGWALAFSCSVRTWNRDYSNALLLSDRCRDYCAEQGQAFWLSASIATGGISRYYLGEKEKGLESLRQGLASYEMTGSIVVTPLWRALLGEVLVDAGELDEALVVVEAGLSTVAQYGEKVSEPFLRRVKGDVLRLRGLKEAAALEYERSFEMAAAQGSRMRALQTAIAWVRLEASPANLERVAQVYGGFTEGHGCHDLEVARQLLDA